MPLIELKVIGRQHLARVVQQPRQVELHQRVELDETHWASFLSNRVAWWTFHCTSSSRH